MAHKMNWKRAHYNSRQIDDDGLFTRKELSKQANALLKTSQSRPKPAPRPTGSAMELTCLVCHQPTDRIIITDGRMKNGCMRTIALCCQRHAAEAGFGWAGN
jgi:hypothetical protein